MTAKKNDENTKEYTEEEAFPIRKWILQNFFVMAGVLMAIVNLFMVTRLAPLNQDIALIKGQVEAMDIKTHDSISREEFDLINGRLDRIQDSLNTLINIHIDN